MKLVSTGLVIVSLLLFAPSAESSETRCGWIVNPTPGNWSLIDAHREWYIAAQSGEAASGMDLIPDLTEKNWVVTNGSSYGYGCACMKVETSADSISSILSFTQLELSRCHDDKKLLPINN